MARVLPYPWSLLSPRDDRSGSLSLEDCEAGPRLNAESLTFFTRSVDEALPRPSWRHGMATRLAEGVLLNPQTEGGRRPGVLSILTLPHEKCDEWRVRVGAEECVIPVFGTLRRAHASEEPVSSNSAEVAFRDTIEVLAGFFQEAVALTRDAGHPEFREFAGQSIARLTWAAIWERWNAVSSGDEPRMAQIVEIAIAHLAAIRDVCERPRRMLVRHRQLVSLPRVQELDSACLRHLIQRPGRSVVEKAGVRQEILGITRRETVDTAENRVIREFIRLCQHRARAYERENRRAREHARVKMVGDLRRTCERLDAVSPISEVSRIVGVPRPNYVLQKDRRYHSLWIQYDRLRREEEAVDNLWASGRVLWADFLRGIVLASLSGRKCAGRPAWSQESDVPAYLGAEQRGGRFIPAVSISSRWIHRTGRVRLLIIHPDHAHLCPGLGEMLPRMGADLALVLYPTSGPARPRSILSMFSIMSLAADCQQRQEVVASLQRCLDHMARQMPDVAVRGILARGEWVGSSGGEAVGEGRVAYLAAPAGASFWFREFPEVLTSQLEEMSR